MRRPRWGVLSEDGTVYGVGRWKGGRKRHGGSLCLAILECHLLRKVEPRARVVRRGESGAPLPAIREVLAAKIAEKCLLYLGKRAVDRGDTHDYSHALGALNAGACGIGCER